MSLPDTIFIFVLALIIFGPKKLPEIGRQLGKLVGEFRRASNEFKFQIEEELRQADLMDKRNQQPTIAAPIPDPTVNTDPSTAATNPADTLPVGQHPNIESVNTTELNEFGVPAFGHSSAETDPVEQGTPSETTAMLSESTAIATENTPTIAPAVGSQARTSIPFAPTDVATSSESAVPLNSHPAETEAEITHG